MKTLFLLPVLVMVALPALSPVALAHSDGDHAHAQEHMKNLVIALPNGLRVEHPVVLVAGRSARTVAAYMVIENTSETDDRLIAAEAGFAGSAGLHTHIMEDDIAKMRPVEGGFDIPAGGQHELAKGGDHIMFMGLTEVPVAGETMNVTLTFEKAGSFTLPFMVVAAGDLHQGHD